MNDIHVHPVNAAGKKQIRSPAARSLAVVVGLALLLPGLALAGEPIPGVDVKLGKNPGGIIVASSKTDSQGNFHFDKLPVGNYTLKLPGLPDQSFTVGAEGSISAVLSKEPDGTASISVNGPSGLADNGTRLIRITNVRANANQLGKANQPIITKDVDNLTTQVGSTSNNLPGLGSATRSNKKAGIAKAEEPPPDEPAGAPVVTTRSNKKAGIAAGEEPTPDDEGVLPGKTGHAPKPVSPGTGPHRSSKADEPPPDEKPGISDQGAAGGLISYGTAPPPKDGALQIKGSDSTPVTRTDLPGYPITGINISLPQNPDASSSTAPPPKDAGKKAAGSPVGFGRGNTPGAGTGMGDGPGMSPGMSPANNMGSSIGPGPGMGDGPMGPGAGRH